MMIYNLLPRSDRIILSWFTATERQYNDSVSVSSLLSPTNEMKCTSNLLLSMLVCKRSNFGLDAVTLWYFQLIFLTRFWQMVVHLNLQPKKKSQFLCHELSVAGDARLCVQREEECQLKSSLRALAQSSSSNFVSEKRKCQMFLSSWRRERASTGPCRVFEVGFEARTFPSFGNRWPSDWEESN